jgi:hypothetical protein
MWGMDLRLFRSGCPCQSLHVPLVGGPFSYRLLALIRIPEIGAAGPDRCHGSMDPRGLLRPPWTGLALGVISPAVPL